MINAVSGAAEKIPAPNRLSGEESLKRRELAQPAMVAVAEQDSAVVEISSEGARRSQARAQTPSEPVEQVQALPNAANVGVTATNSAKEKELNPAATSASNLSVLAEQAIAPAQQANKSETTEFDEADANQDGTVNVLERRAFDFMHPTLKRYPGSTDEQTPRTVAAELKAYEAVARSGRNL
jgi:hypothetical protein